MIWRLPHIPSEFRGGKWQGVSPRELDFGELSYISRYGQNEVDRAIARQEIYRRLQAAKQRRLHDRNNSRKNGHV